MAPARGWEGWQERDTAESRPPLGQDAHLSSALRGQLRPPLAEWTAHLGTLFRPGVPCLPPRERTF